ncbi:helix-turn-helix domain-containing protein [Streptomyces sp. NBC_00267]|uniref:helix-turn-helix domain-containing protein n=1 Tax=unclassified Streptomyces TaxID=2593676 RepID=UPI003FA72220
MSAWDDCQGRTSTGRTVSTDDGVAEVTEFAALLTELKGRTERSYGSLARRLGMNTSTLHRYCAGEAVPQDFAPVERLAEFCGATPEERLELHRRWLRAVAARQRPRTTAATAATATTGTPEAPEAPKAQEAPRSPEAVHTSKAAETSQPSETGTTAAATAATGASETSAEPEASRPADGVVRIPGGRGAPPRPRRRHRRTTVAIGVGCAVLATLGALSALPGGGHPSASGEVAPSASATGSTRTTAPHHSPTAGTRPASSPPPDGSTSPTARHERTSSARDSSPVGGKAAAPASGVPLAWTVDSQLWAQGCGHDYVIDKPPAQVPPPPAEQDAGPWASAQGAVHGRETNVEISVQGRSSTAVVLTALRVRVVGRAAPLTGTVYAMDQGCGGSLSKRYFAVDLDKDRPVAHSVAGDDAGTPVPALSLPYRVSSTDPEVLLVTARTETCACDWYLELDWSSQGRTGTVRVDDRGRPFRTSGIKGLPRYWYGTDDNGERQWVPTD